MTGRLIRLTTALAVLMVVGVAAVISYQHQRKRNFVNCAGSGWWS